MNFPTFVRRLGFWCGGAAIWLGAAGCMTPPAGSEHLPVVSEWDRFERSFTSSAEYQNPPHQAELAVKLTAPSGRTHRVLGFWDGGATWRFRFSPDELGRWSYSTDCSDPGNLGLQHQTGAFMCTAATGRTRFTEHGAVILSPDRHYLIHEDDTPFFWIADTAWNGPLLSTRGEWDAYIRERVRQNFSAVQWVATQWRAAPAGDQRGELAYAGDTFIRINPSFFQRLDERVDALDRAGLLSAPALLWDSPGARPQANPGVTLPEDDAIILAKYMVARWGANHLLWILSADGDYSGGNLPRWKRIARAVFSGIDHAPVTLLPRAGQWVYNDFISEPWYGLAGYQSGADDSPAALRWIYDGPPARDWKKEPARPFINLAPPYEFQVAPESKQRISPHAARRALYWSLLNAPTAGVTYGGLGVWGWDNGTRPPTDYPAAGVPLPLGNAVEMPAAEEITYVQSLFNSLPFWDLRPAEEALAAQPGAQAPERHISVSKTSDGDVWVAYTPVQQPVQLTTASLPPRFTGVWYNPRTGDSSRIEANLLGRTIQFNPPAPEANLPAGESPDWVLVLKRSP